MIALMFTCCNMGDTSNRKIDNNEQHLEIQVALSLYVIGDQILTTSLSAVFNSKSRNDVMEKSHCVKW